LLEPMSWANRPSAQQCLLLELLVVAAGVLTAQLHSGQESHPQAKLPVVRQKQLAGHALAENWVACSTRSATALLLVLLLVGRRVDLRQDRLDPRLDWSGA